MSSKEKIKEVDIIDIENLLKRAVEYNNKNRPTPLEQGNLFTVLDMENKEVSAHSAFLYFVFKPFKDKEGNIDNTNLKMLVKMLLHKAERDEEIDKVDDYTYLDIYREYVCDMGRLDFYIITSAGDFVIELKVWSGEGTNQISRYITFLKENDAYNHNVYFLTPYGIDSVTGDSISISLKDDIEPVLADIVDYRQGYENYTVMLNQYRAIIGKLTGRNTMNGENIIKTKSELLAVSKIEEDRKNLLTSNIINIFEAIRTKLGAEISIEGYPTATRVAYEYGNHAIEHYYESTNLYPAIAYKIESFPLQNDMTLNEEKCALYFFVEVSNCMYTGITPRNKVDKDLQKVNVRTMINNYKKITTKKDIKCDKNWMIYKYTKFDAKYIQFHIDKLNVIDNCLLNIFDDKMTLQEGEIDKLVNAIKADYKKVCGKIFDTRKDLGE